MGVCASLIPLGSPHAHTMRVRRMCGEPNEIDVTAIAPLATGSCAPAGGSAAWGGLGGKGCQQFRGGGRSWGVRAGELAESPPPPPHTHTHTHTTTTTTFILPPFHWRADKRRDHGGEVER